jgi:hypothetical protein
VGLLATPLIINAANLEQHPLAKEFRFAPLTEEELQQLAEDIAKHGLHGKIVIYEGMVLDGWTRYAAIKRIGRGFTGAQFTVYDARSGDPKLYVIARNAFRRHLNQGQRAAYAKMYYDLMPAAKEGRPHVNKSEAKDANDDEGPKSSGAAPTAEENPSPIGDGFLRPDKERKAKAAAAIGSSVKSIEQFTRLEKLDPDKAAEVKAGTKTLNAALKEAVKKTGKKAPRKPRVVTELKPEVTAKEIFDLLGQKGEKTIEIRWVGLGRATFTTDATIQPKKELIVPTRGEFMAYATEKKLDSGCSAKQWEVWEEAGWVDGNQTPIINWKAKLLNFARGGFGQFQQLGRKKENATQKIGKDIKL